MTPHSINFGLTRADIQAIARAVLQSERTLARQQVSLVKPCAPSRHNRSLIRQIEDTLGTVA